MPTTLCPDCGRPVSDAIASCIHCGRPMRGRSPVAPAAYAAKEQSSFREGGGSTAPPSLPKRAEETTFFQVSTVKFVTLSICTFSLYTLYWAYKNWQLIQEQTGEKMMPFWRAAFQPLWNFSLFARVEKAATVRSLSVGWSGGLLALLALLLSGSGKLPAPYFLFSLLCFLPYLPVLGTISRINEPYLRANPSLRNSRFTGWNIAVTCLGGLFVLFALIGSFLPDTPSAGVGRSEPAPIVEPAPAPKVDIAAIRRFVEAHKKLHALEAAEISSHAFATDADVDW